MSKELVKELETLLGGAGTGGDSGLWLDDFEEFEIVEEGGFVSEGKYEVSETIIKYKEKLFCVLLSRSGSYFTDYYYSEPTVYEVVPKQITKTIYEAVK